MPSYNKVFLTHRKALKAGFNPDDYVTIFADASFCPDTGAAGWGGWAKFGPKGETVKHSESFTCKDSITAELIGIQRMIQIVIESDDISLDKKIVIIQCDCVEALKRCDFSQLRELGAKFVKLKHVKGHSGEGNPRSAVNDFCDKLAREKMLEKRGEIKRGRNV